MGFLEMYDDVKNMSNTPGYTSYTGIVFKTSVVDGSFNFKKLKRAVNDEARAMVLYGPLKKGTVIRIFDSPKGKKNDDWLEITVLQDVWNQQITFATLERSWQDSNVKVAFRKKNGLDGKVSRVEINVP